MEIEKVSEKNRDANEILIEKNNLIDKLTTEKANLTEQIADLEKLLNERDIIIYNLALKISKL